MLNYKTMKMALLKKLFGDEDITIASIVKKLNDTKIRRKKKMLMYSVDCIYCLDLLFSIFRKHLGLSLVFRFFLLDNLDSLNMYNWGEAVHGLLVSSLGRASETLNMQKNSAGVHLAGCVVVLQVS